MRIHTDKLTEQDFLDVLARVQRKGRIAFDVMFKTLSQHRSQDYARSFEVQLEASSKDEGDGRKWANSGSYGAATAYTATWDEWGWFLAELYDIDAFMRVGPKGSPFYESDEDFHEKTGISYHPASLREAIFGPSFSDTNDPYPFVIGRASGRAGTRGKGRSDGENLPGYIYREAIANPGKLIYGYVRYMPRTPGDIPA